MRTFVGGLAALWLMTPAAGATQWLFHQPDASEHEIVFVHADDLWVVPRAGGSARRLVTEPGSKFNPRFSPDGSQIAFSSTAQGNLDVFVISSEGGTAKRVTHHPGRDQVLDWVADGEHLLIASDMTSERSNFSKLFVVNANGGHPRQLPPAFGATAALSADQRKLAFTMLHDPFFTRTLKRYRGGRAPDLWLLDLETRESRRIAPDPAVDASPMWFGDSLFFLSDRGPEARANIWVATDTNPRQVTFFRNFDVRNPAIGVGEIVFEQAGEIFRLDLETEHAHRVPIELPESAEPLPSSISVRDSVRNMALSPDGKRVLLEARGEVFMFDIATRKSRNLTSTSGIAERYPSWVGNDGRYAYLSDRHDEYQVTVARLDQDGETQLTEPQPGFRYRTHWSPQGDRAVFVDNTMTIWFLDQATGVLTVVDHKRWPKDGTIHAMLENFTVSWSPDGRWVAYARGLENQQQAIFLFDSRQMVTRQVSSGFYGDWSPVFGSEGRRLFFLSARDFNPVSSDIEPTWAYAGSTRIVSLALPEDNEWAAADRDVTILPVDAGKYADLHAVAGGLVYRRLPAFEPDADTGPVVFFDLEQETERTLLEGASSLLAASNAPVALARDADDRLLRLAIDGSNTPDEIDLDALRVDVDLHDEWEQMLSDVYRYERDFFYDPELHGVDWNGLRDRYRELIPAARTRADVYALLRELVAELSAEHLYVRDNSEDEPSNVGLLGADLSVENGAYRIERILDPGPWVSEARSPLTEAGTPIQAGDYLLAVNDVELDVRQDPWAPLQGLALQTARLRLSRQADGSDAWETDVTLLDDESRLRELDWVEQNRQYVEKKSRGRIGYLYVPNTRTEGQNDLIRQFRAQFARDGLIVDARFNAGGALGDRFVELLNRPLYVRLIARAGNNFHIPEITHVGPKTMLINAWNVSGGDGFPHFFRLAGLGPLIGTATTGAFIGPGQSLPLIDGGVVSAPPSRIADTNERWVVEGIGVRPDIEVLEDPGRMTGDADPQLNRAIAEILRQLEESNSQ